MTDLLQMPIVTFTFVFLIPLVLVAGGLVSFFAVGALFDLLDNPEALKKTIRTRKVLFSDHEIDVPMTSRVSLAVETLGCERTLHEQHVLPDRARSFEDS